jgi:hypothetical protein
MQQNPSWEANSLICWRNSPPFMVSYDFHESSPLGCIQTLLISSWSVLMLSRLCRGFPFDFFHRWFRFKMLCAFLLSPCALWNPHAYLISFFFWLILHFRKISCFKAHYVRRKVLIFFHHYSYAGTIKHCQKLFLKLCGLHWLKNPVS